MLVEVTKGYLAKNLLRKGKLQLLGSNKITNCDLLYEIVPL